MGHRYESRLQREVEPPPVRNVPDVRYTDVAGQDAALAQLSDEPRP